MTHEPAAARRPSPARTAMIDAAERIVAEDGLPALTLRRVQSAAGQSNKSAANYHFGSRDGLIAAVLDERMAPIDAHRRILIARIDETGRPGGPGHLRELTEALVVPLARRVLTTPGSAYARFLAQSMVSPELAGIIARQSTMFTVAEVQRRMVAALTADAEGRAGTDAPAGTSQTTDTAATQVRCLDPETAGWRTGGLLGHVIGALAAAEPHADPDGDPAFGARVTARLTDTCHGMLTAPTGPPAIDLSAPLPPAGAAPPADPLPSGPAIQEETR